MRMKKWISALFVAAGLAVSVPALTAMPGMQSRSVVSAAENDSTQAADGWNQDGLGWYYLSNGVKTVGWKTIDNLRYYFDANGYRVSGVVKIGKYTYLFRPESSKENPGSLCTGITGLVQLGTDSDVYYYLTATQKGRIATGKWIKIDKARYYANAKGQIKMGTIKVGGKRYHITPNGRMTFYGKSTYDGNYYYAGADGVLKTGRQTINGKLYYFDKKTGKRLEGVNVKIGKYTLYFHKGTGDAKTGWLKTGGNTYYYDSSYHRVTGWKMINGKRYYFDPAKDGARVGKGWKKINGENYYFSKSGVVKTGFFDVTNKKGVKNRYYADANGKRQSGWITVDGRKYYMNPSNYVMKTGWLTNNGKTYYLNPNKDAVTYGAAITGWKEISDGTASYMYYFESDGARHTGWYTENGKRYYFDSSGKMYTGKHTIDGTTYDFGTTGGIPINQEWRIEVNRRYNFVVVYRGDTEMNAFVCSTAADGVTTPVGTFKLQDKLRWHTLNGPTYGQYCSHITWNILFHSVPCMRPNDSNSLNPYYYNQLGTAASGGCIRLTVRDAKYLYDSCPIGTKVVISDSLETVPRPKTVQVKTAPKIPLTQTYDPTDPAYL